MGTPIEAFPRLEYSDGTRLLVESGKLFARCLEKRRIFATFKDIVAQTMDCDGMLVSHFSRATQKIRCDYAFVDGEEADTSIFPSVPFEPEPGRGMQSEVIRSGEARLFSDVNRRVEEGKGKFYEKKGERVEELPKGSQPKAQSAIMAPLKLDGEVVGVAQVMADREGAYDESHLLFFEGIALQMAAALNNAELFESKQTEIAAKIKVEDALREAERKVSELNLGLEKLVAERTAELERTLSDLDEFCYSASHDLRTPLRGIAGSAMILLEDHTEGLPEEVLCQLRAMRDSVKKMSHVIDGLLATSRVSRARLNRAHVDISALATRVGTAYGAGGRFRFDIAPGLKTYADPEMMEIAVEALVDNAVKFSAGSPAPQIEFGAAERNGRHIYHISDNGIGFDPRYAEKLFQPFEKLHRDGEYSGTGMGLAVVKRIVERHGGQIWAEGSPGEGATISFTLG